MKRMIFGFFLILSMVISASSYAALIGQWIFEGTNPLADTTGNYGDLALMGNATIVNGQLDVNGVGTTPTGWAITTGTGYNAGTITNKTLVSWITLQSLSATATAGSAITIDSISDDNFDGIIYGENSGPNRWSTGSNGGARYQAFSPGYQETTTGTQILMVFTYEDMGGGSVRITGYRNGVQIGQYTDSPLGTWVPSNNEIIFGARHTVGANTAGALDALIDEARIYNHVLSLQEIQALAPVHPIAFANAIPSMNEWGMIVLSLMAGGIAVYFFRKRQIV